MTKKDYILIADVLKDERIGYVIKELLIDLFCYKLKEENPKFDEKKFRAYILNHKEK